MESNKIWKLNLIDSGDGSGDALVELPDELLAKVGWIEGELLEIEQVEKYIVIKKLPPNHSPYNELPALGSNCTIIELNVLNLKTTLIKYGFCQISVLI